MGIILAIVIFSLIVLFHEFGHFMLAKKNGIDVDEFALGMGPTLWSTKYKGTKYAVHLFPIGGFCAMGEDEEATDSPGNFNNKPVWARISVIAAGPVFNFILAFVLAVILVLMIGSDKPVLSFVEDGYPAAEAGIKEGDTITRMGDKSIHLFREITIYNQFHQGEKTEITFVRDGKEYTEVLEPMMDDELGYYRFGIGGGIYKRMDLLSSIKYGAYEVKYWISITLDSLKMLLTGKVGINQMSGPVGIVDMVDDTYNESKSYGAFAVLIQLINIAILLSANLGVMNLLPLPALDGGRLIFLFIEAVRRKRVPPEKEGYVHMVGIALLMVLMVVIMFNDIRRIFF